MNIVIDSSAIQAIDLSDIRAQAQDGDWQFDTGPQPYKLYAYLSTLFKGSVILDVGTEWGNSALAFSYSPNNHVMSYDVAYMNADIIRNRNIEFKIMNFMEDDTIPWDNVSIIMIDVNPHDAVQEPVMIDFLYSIGWSGLLILDDIGSMFPPMKNWFQSLNEEKWELDQSIGHYSGTGLVNFRNRHRISFA